ncbi:hypothetical protein E2P81_ATG11478 [Venturia nashicola]|uniref:Uncharacterized protein n=1 Tax=Venturia nashicola TaxID=86259 RepID=A0A4Z1PBG8_9PEZI|nr:hypothetical protein E6O75_ATG11170 [Venturia nashicola]TLD35359.1 hypothetical protein E2P81_ATG11478 [Venturia nashicola]
MFDVDWMLDFVRALKVLAKDEPWARTGSSVVFLTCVRAGATVLERCGRWLAALCGQARVLAVLTSRGEVKKSCR